MLRTTIISGVVGLTVMALLPAGASAWGGSRSASGSGSRGGSYSHSSETSGGGGGYSHSGSSSYTSARGQTYSGEHSGSGSYGSGYHGSAEGSRGGSAEYSGGYHGGAYGGAAYGGYHTDYHGSTYGGTAYAGAYHGPDHPAYPASGDAAVAAYHAPTWGAAWVPPAAGVYAPPVQAAAVANTAVAAPPAMQVGVTVAALPAGYTTQTVNGVTYYVSPPNWYQLQINNGNASFVVVPAP